MVPQSGQPTQKQDLPFDGSLASFYAQKTLEEFTLSPDRREWMKLLLFDQLAVTVGGANLDSSRVARNAFRTSSDRTDQSVDARCRLFGTEKVATAEAAAMVNGITAHGLELDDTFEAASHHPGVVIFPAVFATGEDNDSTMQELLEAATVGYDVMCHAGLMLGAADSYGRGFHPTGVAGALGATAAICRLKMLSTDVTSVALGLAANLASGSLEFLSDGSWTKRLNAGNAAKVGITSVRLAEAGFTSPALALEGRDGFLSNFGTGLHTSRFVNWEPGEFAWNTSIKLYPCCRYMHGNIDLLLELTSECPDLNADKIEKIELAVIEAGSRLVSVPRDAKMTVESQVDAQFNMFFGGALALTRGSVNVDDFENAADMVRSLKPVMEKIECVTDPDIEASYPDDWAARVTLTFADGTSMTKTTQAFKGSPGRRVTQDDLLKKASGLIGSEAALSLLKTVTQCDTASVRSFVSEIPVSEK